MPQVVVSFNIIRIEVACSISNCSDAAAAYDGQQKGSTPKGDQSCKDPAWDFGEQPSDCHLEKKMGCYR